MGQLLALFAQPQFRSVDKSCPMPGWRAGLAVGSHMEGTPALGVCPHGGGLPFRGAGETIQLPGMGSLAATPREEPSAQSQRGGASPHPVVTPAGQCALAEHGDSQWWLQQSSLLRPGWWPVQKVAGEWQVTTAVFLCPCPREGCAQGENGQLEGPP